MVSDCELAWLAGIVEGEGSISFQGANSVRVTVQMVDRDIIERCYRVAGLGYIDNPKYSTTHKAQWPWIVQRRDDVIMLLHMILPWLGQRRSQKAQEALIRLDNCRRAGYCIRGHPLVGENYYVSPRGQGQCRECQRLRHAARYTKVYPADDRIPHGLCHCGCGQRTAISNRTRDGNIKGQPKRWVRGHNPQRPLPADYQPPEPSPF